MDWEISRKTPGKLWENPQRLNVGISIPKWRGPIKGTRYSLCFDESQRYLP